MKKMENEKENIISFKKEQENVNKIRKENINYNYKKETERKRYRNECDIINIIYKNKEKEMKNGYNKKIIKGRNEEEKLQNT